MTDHRQGLAVARRIELAPPRSRLRLASVAPADLVALLAYTKALAVHGRCPSDVGNRTAIKAGNTRCALPADLWDRNEWRHLGPCVTWEGHEGR